MEAFRDDDQSTIDQLKAENRRLRTALERLSTSAAFYVAAPSIPPEVLGRMRFAQLVLNGVSKPEAEQRAEVEARDAGRKG